VDSGRCAFPTPQILHYKHLPPRPTEPTTDTAWSRAPGKIARTVRHTRPLLDHTGAVPETGRDRLRELLDAVLQGTDGPAEGGSRRLEDMAEEAFSSPYHFSRLLSRATGEPPVAMRRRVLLERAA